MMIVQSEKEVIEVIEQINNYLIRCLWMDFELCLINKNVIVLAGRVDQSYNDFSIEIEFVEPLFFSSLLDWSAKTGKAFIYLVENQYAYKILDKTPIKQGYHLFAINAEDFDEAPILIVSNNIKCKILNENPFK